MSIRLHSTARRRHRNPDNLSGSTQQPENSGRYSYFLGSNAELEALVGGALGVTRDYPNDKNNGVVEVVLTGDKASKFIAGTAAKHGSRRAANRVVVVLFNRAYYNCRASRRAMNVPSLIGEWYIIAVKAEGVEAHVDSTVVGGHPTGEPPMRRMLQAGATMVPV